MLRTTFSLAPQRAQGGALSVQHNSSSRECLPPTSFPGSHRITAAKLAIRNRREMNGQFSKRAAGLATKMIPGAPSQT
jgi:hypothetical protein